MEIQYSLGSCEVIVRCVHLQLPWYNRSFENVIIFERPKIM